VEPPKNVDPLTIEGQLGMIRGEMVAALNAAAGEYYTALKNRKGVITLPGIIPPTQQELVEQSLKEWVKTTERFPVICEEFVVKFRYQVVASYDAAKMAEEAVYALLAQFFRDKLDRERQDLQTQFDGNWRALTIERSANQQQMGVRLADANLALEFREIAEKERGRTARETQLVVDFKRSLIEFEKGVMTAYGRILSNLTKTLLRIFDDFLLLEDLVPGMQPIPRKTLRSVLQERERHAMKPDITERPFHQRDWPKLRAVMAPILALAPPAPVDMEAAKSPSRSRRRRQAAQAVETTPETEELPGTNSLDTSIHRSVVISRNMEYARYEQELARRIKEIDRYVQSLNAETEAFTLHWGQRMTSINADAIPPDAGSGSHSKRNSK
jgi:hypothetical protein